VTGENMGKCVGGFKEQLGRGEKLAYSYQGPMNRSRW
jgi:hypothetical protein